MDDYGFLDNITDDVLDGIVDMIERKTKQRDAPNPIYGFLEISQNGLPLSTANNILEILRHDTHFKGIAYNTLKDSPEIIDDDGIPRAWTDADDSAARTYIEKVYRISNRQKYDDAIRQIFQERQYDPLMDKLNALQWDGTPRCENFLIDWMGADDTSYNREASRLLFAGAINRALNPGCRYDSVIVLVDKQGGGKSTICQWLAMNSDFYTSLKEIDGQKGSEEIEGIWIVEIEELLAIFSNSKSTKREEQAKAYISRGFEEYRRPYDKRKSKTPRHCIFIGTTNREMFLTDKTGNRRWFPVRCNQLGTYLFDHETECKYYIEQCYAEMVDAYNNHDRLARGIPDSALMNEIQHQQKNYEIDDERPGMIEAFLENKDYTCIAEIWRDCLYPDFPDKDSTRSDKMDISSILKNLGWQIGTQKRFRGLGKQQTYYRHPGILRADDIDFDGNKEE